MVSDIFRIVLFVLGIAAVIVALLGVAYGVMLLHARRLRRQWQSERRTMHFGPQAVTSWIRPGSKSSVASSGGVVALVDDLLIYRGTFTREHDISIPVDQIHWIGRCIFGTPSRAPRSNYSAEVNLEGPGGWRSYNFRLRDREGLLAALHKATELPVGETTSLVSDVLPAQAARMRQSMLGSWEHDFSGMLYLAPDRLLFAWRDAILLDSITALDLYDRHSALDVLGPLDVFTQDLLRIEYTDQHGERQIIGFQVPYARRWGDTIAERCGIELTVHEGRKKKEA